MHSLLRSQHVCVIKGWFDEASHARRVSDTNEALRGVCPPSVRCRPSSGIIQDEQMDRTGLARMHWLASREVAHGAATLQKTMLGNRDATHQPRFSSRVTCKIRYAQTKRIPIKASTTTKGFHMKGMSAAIQ
jgi:hypothetical protein